MPFLRRRRPLVFSEDEQRMLERLRKSRTEQKRRTVRAAILLDSVAGLSDQAIARDHGVNRNTVILCIQKCLRFGVQAALGELPRSGKPRRVSDAAMAWVQNSACQKPNRLRKNTKFGNRISLDSSGKSAPIAGSKNSIITARIRKAHFSAAC